MTESPAAATKTRNRVATRLEDPRPVLLDGALGTELEVRGIASELPLWSTHALLRAPDSVRAVHREYLEAGAEILTANTFRTQARTLARATRGGDAAGDIELADRGRELCGLALDLARQAAGDAAVLIAGSAAPLEDCYRPDLVPGEAALRREHAKHAENLALGGADLILIETMNCIREARAAAAAAADTALPFFASFLATGHGTLLSGEPLAHALDAVASYAPAAVLVNCLPVSAADACVALLRRSGLPFGIYANLGAPTPSAEQGRAEYLAPERFADCARGWVEAGASIVGGCCGTRPAHIRAIATALALPIAST